ncbi:MBL fold metallo-hydrolase [Methylicorpusculum sp.]|uniref:MBL fold metallo-hydrolase n=1 Tax=Methylicorpusculum sp. TaxID=2713644 RepID=UPI002731A140|nr:MBL fold metallo-hydrolase [Methylicorpusculum sp.]MDP2177985.1 MBL fold metallo-hydrolase [Methylicorpusculum sp.]MDP3528134.1 MBL fold metallo-hydrolase [Methylicorpusculum sp.]MDZ4151379.1 MBL fold metallo-hydrolase [Methylicorpusculum sp.]
MKMTKIYEGNYQWIMFGRDVNKPANIIDTNQYMVRTARRCLLMDPGGVELFAPMLAAVLHHAPVEEITDLFASHQDPDIISSLGLWDQALPKAKLHASKLWEGFIRHFGCESIEYVGIPDNGGSIKLDSTELKIIPAHYLHSSANFHIYDAQAKILMSGDVGAALELPGAPIYVDNFDAHTEHMRYFHQRWMPSNQAKRVWIERVRKLDIDIMAPQHGRIFKGDDVKRFLDWFEALDVGVAV